VLICGEVDRAYLVGVAADERAQSGLSGTRGGVDVRLESGSVLVGHVVDVVMEEMWWLWLRLWLKVEVVV